MVDDGATTAVDKDRDKGETFRDRWRKAWPILLGTLVYMIPLFWLWTKTGYPESFGFRIAARGEAGVIENWWYSYNLIERHGFWDVLTFAYMWLAVIGIVAWICWLVIRDRRLAVNEKGDAA